MDKHADIIVHKLAGGAPREGETVSCVVDATRRTNITKNHSSTHILNASSREVLGSWVWQHSAFKEDDHARLDITHHSSLSDSQVRQIEDTANGMIRENLPVSIKYFDRGTAEQKYGFRIYQGGVVPVKSVRIVSIKDRDVEACGGTHVKKTGDIELVKITKTKRIQDGVVRLEFVSGQTAFDYQRRQALDAEKKADENKQREELQRRREENKERARKEIPVLLARVLSGESFESDGITSRDKRCFVASKDRGEYFHLNFGKKVATNDGAAFCGIYQAEKTVRVMVYSGSQSGIDASIIAREVSAILGGSGGGDAGFAQGGGRDTSKIDEAIAKARSMVFG